MRRLTIVAAAALLALSPACSKKKPVQYIEEGGGQLSAAVNVADPKTAIQLLRGFHDVENNSWRWTTSKFAFAFRPPRDAGVVGATLFLDFVLPDVVLQKVNETKLTATVDGKALEPQAYKTVGPQRFERTVPAEMLKGDVVTVEFSLDKFLPAGSVELRELGIIVNAAGLQPAGGAKAETAAPAAK